MKKKRIFCSFCQNSIYIYIYIYTWKGVAPSPTPQCSSYRKGSLRVALDYSRQLKYIYIDKIKENGFELTKKRSRRYPATTITDADYADDIAILANTPDQAETLLHSLERAAASIGLYGHLPPITKTIQVRRTRHAGHCWRSRDELIRDVLLWIPTHGRAKAQRPARTYIQQLCEDTGCCPEDLPRAMNDREEWRERVRDIRAASTI